MNSALPQQYIKAKDLNTKHIKVILENNPFLTKRTYV